jgi:cell division protein FtsI (penicillin-binding protein 3)
MRMVGTASVFLAFFCIAMLRVAQLCVLQGPELRSRAVRQHRQKVASLPDRGPIVDRNGDLLALTVESGAAFVRPALFDPDYTTPIAHLLDLEPHTVAMRAQLPSRFVWLKRDLTPPQAAALLALKASGIGVEPGRRRIYPRGALGGQLLGTAGIDLQGLAGIELFYDSELRGRSRVVRVERDARGRGILRDGVAYSLEEPGARIELTIDAALQSAAESEIEAAVLSNRAKAGMAVVMDPQSGEILAMAHYPSFDPNERQAGAIEAARIRAISDTFEPGSTFKAFPVAAALEAGVVAAEERFNCEGGSYRVGSRVVHDHDRYGWLTLTDVVRVSSNICTAKVGERLGAERMHEALRGFGFHAVTGIDLPGEKANALRAWQKWARINLVTISFGQGIAITPIQLVRAYAALANGGRLLRPYVVRRVVGDDGRVLLENQPEVVGRPISAETARAVTGVLRTVVQNGTGTKAKIDGLSVAGKTGTAQKVDPSTGRYSTRDRMSSFIGYLPAEDPRLVILVVIDTPRAATYGGIVAAPAFRRIAEFAVDRLGLNVTSPPSQQVYADPPEAAIHLAGWQGDQDSGNMPSFVGMSMRQALRRAQRLGWKVQFEGSGLVVGQEPQAGATAPESRILTLRLAARSG